MSKATFLVSLKSAIDKMAHTLAVSKGVVYVDLDDSTATPEVFRSENTAIVLEYNTLVEDPSDPLYAGVFNIGVRAVNDPGNYGVLTLLGDVESLFPKGERVEIFDSYELVETARQGVLIPGDATVSPQQYEMSSGIRMVTVEFKAIRDV